MRTGATHGPLPPKLLKKLGRSHNRPLFLCRRMGMILRALPEAIYLAFRYEDDLRAALVAAAAAYPADWATSSAEGACGRGVVLFAAVREPRAFARLAAQEPHVAAVEAGAHLERQGRHRRERRPLDDGAHRGGGGGGGRTDNTLLLGLKRTFRVERSVLKVLTFVFL